MILALQTKAFRAKAALVVILGLSSSFAYSAQIPSLNFPVAPFVGGAQTQTYSMSERPNSVFVFEGLRLDCSYCNTNAPAVEALAEEMKSSEPRVEVLDLCIDAAMAKCAQWRSRHNPKHPVIQDVGRKVFSALYTEAVVPQAFVVDCTGTMVGNVIGSWGVEGAAKIRQLIAKALETTCVPPTPAPPAE